MYLCSMFYINFSPLWAGVTGIIASYAVNDCKAVFWNVFGAILDQSSKAAGMYVYRVVITHLNNDNL